MYNLGFIKVGVAVPELKVGNCDYNVAQIIKICDEAHSKDIKILSFPELSITGYTCQDLFNQGFLIHKALLGLKEILLHTRDYNTLIVVGLPIEFDNQLFNCATVIFKGQILGIVPKLYLPNYNEFYEKRWFSTGDNTEKTSIDILDSVVPFGNDLLFKDKVYDSCMGIEICEDLWTPIPPSSYHCINGANIIVNLSASNETVSKADYRKELVKQQSAKLITGYLYGSCGINESTTDTVFGGHALIGDNGSIISESDRFNFGSQLIYSDIDIDKLQNDRRKFKTYMDNRKAKMVYRTIEYQPDFIHRKPKLSRQIDSYPFVPSNRSKCDERCKEIFSIQTCGLAKRLKHTCINKAVIGISGGLDSTLALLVTVKAFDMLDISRKNIIGITMPGFGTSNRTHSNSLALMESLGITSKEISIKEACIQHFKDIEHDINVHDVTYENVQARERTQILMDYANKVGGLVIGTGDLSELALGWCTYNGDHMSMYAVNVGVPKTLVKYLVKWVAEYEFLNTSVNTILLDVLDTPVSPELLPTDKEGKIQQETENIVGPYELHDFFLFNMIRNGFSPKKIFFLATNAFNGKYTREEILNWLNVFYKRFFTQQFKRSCLPDGPKVGSVSLSPRSDWRMPSDVSYETWVSELKTIKL